MTKEDLVDVGWKSFEAECQKLNAEIATEMVTKAPVINYDQVSAFNYVEYRAMLKAVADMIESRFAQLQSDLQHR
ncbi:hypothetical protein GCM10025859_59860 [Alicyclobacillus fastidiosus]|nr:hypothetical protein GCM10025859_01360 [Alicyclobacillus fastidiosus]GMA65546.1 hypothetical protein GCM10025859_59860 [Alicyclobacillus fastidiosus]